MDLVANQMPVSAITKGEITLSGGDQWRPMIHVRDIANAIVTNLDRPVRGVYNLAAANLQIRDLADACHRITRCRINIVSRSGDPRNYRADTSKAIRDKVFNPFTTYTVEDGIHEFVNLAKSGRVKDVNNSVYFNVKHLGETHGAINR
jgi:nucleoside-diphosphate-sugar epimerase